MWKWIRERKGIVFGVVGGIILFIYGIIPTLQPSNFGRVYAAYGGIFIISAVIWGLFVDKKKPDRYEVKMNNSINNIRSKLLTTLSDASKVLYYYSENVLPYLY